MRRGLPLLLLLMACAARPAAKPAVTPVGAATSEMPAFHASRWINTDAPLTPATLRGKVVLVDFWEYTCVNCLRTLPFVKAWHRQYAARGLVVVGVHAPEFEFGKEPENVYRGITEFGLTYPIALDNDFETWRAYDNHSWPAKYLFDANGRLRGKWVGEGRYPEIEASIRVLLLEADERTRLPRATEETETWQAASGVGGAARRGVTSETYLGTARRKQGAVRFDGEWTDAKEYVEHVGTDTGRLTMTFTAGEVNLVMAPGANGGKAAAVKVKLDGHLIDEWRGADVGADGYARFDRSGMIRLIAGAPKESHELVLETKDPGLRMFAFTFGP